MGTDIVKLFIGSYHSPDDIIHMPVDIARAAVAEGHRHGQLIFAHPSDFEGLRIAMESGVDVLAHAPSKVDGVDDALIKTMVDRHMAMIPTLKLFSGGNHIERIREIVARFHAFGGTLLFGTDTGFLTDYDVKEEYRQLGLAGLSFHDVLAMLTTAPAARFKGFSAFRHDQNRQRWRSYDLACRSGCGRAAGFQPRRIYDPFRTGNLRCDGSLKTETRMIA